MDVTDEAPDLGGKVAVVSGSAVGIGRALCLALARHGASVAALDIDTTGNEATAALVAEAGGTCLARTCDVGDAGQVREAVHRIVDRFRHIDLLVNNAALWTDTTLTGGDYVTQVDAFHRSLGACLTGSFHVAAAAVPVMPPGSDIVNVITEHINATRLITGLPATGYDCAKFGQWRLTESWAVELAPRGIRVNGLAFGATDTPMLRAVSARMAEVGMHPDDVANAVLNVVAQGADGPTGRTYEFGFNRTPREQSLREIAAIRDAAATPPG